MKTLLLAGLLASLAASATTPVALYPIQGKVDAATRQGIVELLHGGVVASQGRQGFTPAAPFLITTECHPPTAACVAGLGQGHHVLYADAKPTESGAVAVTVWLVSPDAKRSRPVRFAFDPELQDIRAAYYAIELLERTPVAVPGSEADVAAANPAPPTPEPDLAVSDAAPPDSSAPPPETASNVYDPPRSPPPAGAPSAPTPSASNAFDPPRSPPGYAPSAPTQSAEPAHQPGSGSWMASAAPIVGYGGVAAFAAGAVFGALGRTMTDDLTRRYALGELVAADRAKYDQVRLFGVLANTLMIGGGVAAATGVTFWGMSLPPSSSRGGGAYFSVSGRF